MGLYNSAQRADLIRIYTLDSLGWIIDLKLVGLYNNDGLVFIPDNNSPQNVKKHYKIIRVFNLLGFEIEITSHLKIVNFLDIRFNLENNTFEPSRKNTHTPTNINRNSNHPRPIVQ